LMLRILHEFAIDPASLIHGLQNHDELTLELVHFWSKHKDDLYTFGGRTCTGSELREQIRATMYERLTGENAPYNLPFVTNGIASTTASVVAAALGMRDVNSLTPEEISQIQRAHLLLAMYNALQPGIFALSGWDLVGALPLPASAVEPLLADGDTRWINRGAYDLAAVNPTATASHAGLPKATALYGPLTEQLQRADSFASQLQRLLAVRQQYGVYASRQVEIPTVKDKGLLVLVHELPNGQGTQVTALNFGTTPVEEAVTISGAQPGPVVELLSGADEEPISATGQLSIRLAGHEGKAYLIGGAVSGF
jgi:trehalose synthase